MAVHPNNTQDPLDSGIGYEGIVVKQIDGDLVLAPNGDGALQADVTDSTAVGGNARGIQAVDWQMDRGAASSVASGVHSTISGGRRNVANGTQSTVSGGFGNIASSAQTTVGGGDTNSSTAQGATVGGGSTNTASGARSTVGGGVSNTAAGAQSTVGGGEGNTASMVRSTIAGGYSNTITGQSYNTIGGGYINTCSGERGVVGGGSLNNVSGGRACIPGGESALADHYGEFAVGSGRFTVVGDAQRGHVGLRCNTTDAAATVLTLDGAVESAANRFGIAANTVYQFTIECTAVQTGGTSGTRGDNQHFFAKGAIINKAGATTISGTIVYDTPYGDVSATSWTFVVTASNTNDCLVLTFTGETGADIQVNATMRYTKTGF